eukprot:CAMPEP_0204340184 /NCGR_PEP_ID=MMETSP0469-20131031/22381_1 /ASSEMBLY_ACC=CAM_ASM_000384 /TAXON_ID=2969 /ORGANISM="Oxyrrhis marina" /LENGTH=600 /DNA_ID=CAMNT_0051324667 /DNA_START=80 /DNA_END=1882 /DNA_ORIENTATION=+
MTQESDDDAQLLESVTIYSENHWVGEDALLACEDFQDPLQVEEDTLRQGTCTALEWTTALELTAEDFAAVLADLGMTEEFKKMASLCQLRLFGKRVRCLGCPFCKEVTHAARECPRAAQRRWTVQATERMRVNRLAPAKSNLCTVVEFLKNVDQLQFHPPQRGPFSFVPPVSQESLLEFRHQVAIVETALAAVAESPGEEGEAECRDLVSQVLPQITDLLDSFLSGFVESYTQGSGMFDVVLQSEDEVRDFTSGWLPRQPEVDGEVDEPGKQLGTAPTSSGLLDAGGRSALSGLINGQERAQDADSRRRPWFVPSGAVLVGITPSEISHDPVTAARPVTATFRAHRLDMVHVDLTRKQRKYRQVYSVVTDYLVKAEHDYNKIILETMVLKDTAESHFPAVLQQGSRDPTTRQRIATEEILYAAVKCRPILSEIVHFIAAEVGGVALVPRMKGLFRTLEKAILRYDGRVDRVLDVARASIEVTSMDQVHRCLDLLNNSDRVQLVRVKNRFQHPTEGGWSDLQLNVAFTKEDFWHVGEVQIVHHHLMVVRRNMGAHEEYSQFRGEQEILDIARSQADASGVSMRTPARRTASDSDTDGEEDA